MVMVLLNVGPMGPRGLGPNHFSSLSQNYFVFFKILGVPKIKNVILHENKCIFGIFAVLANVDSSLRLKICKIAI